MGAFSWDVLPPTQTDYEIIISPLRHTHTVLNTYSYHLIISVLAVIQYGNTSMLNSPSISQLPPSSQSLQSATVKTSQYFLWPNASIVSLHEKYQVCICPFFFFCISLHIFTPVFYSLQGESGEGRLCRGQGPVTKETECQSRGQQRAWRHLTAMPSLQPP